MRYTSLQNKGEPDCHFYVAVNYPGIGRRMKYKVVAASPKWAHHTERVWGWLDAKASKGDAPAIPTFRKTCEALGLALQKEEANGNA